MIKPIEPQKFIKEEIVVKSIPYFKMEKDKLLKNHILIDFDYIKFKYSYYDDHDNTFEICICFIKEEAKENPHYEKEFEKYKKNYEKYLKYEENLKNKNLALKEKKKKQKYDLYLKLKKEFEKKI